MAHVIGPIPGPPQTSFHNPGDAASPGYKHLLHLITDMPPPASRLLRLTYVSKTEADAIKREPEVMLGSGALVINYTPHRTTAVKQLHCVSKNVPPSCDDNFVKS